jgi:nitric oxide reductase NorD protein
MPTSAAERVDVVALHPAFLAALESLPERLRQPAILEELSTLLAEAAEAMPDLEPALASHLGFLLNSLDVNGLRRWILTGLRLYPNHPGALSSYLKLEDPHAAQAIVTESEGNAFERSRHSLQFYTTGFGQHELALAARRQRKLNSLPLRSVISEGTLLMPDHYLAWDGASRGNIYRAAVAHALAHLQFSPRHQPAGKKKPLLLAVLSLIEDARVERLAAQRYPGWLSLWVGFHVASGEKNELTFTSLSARLARALIDPSYQDQNHWVNKGRDLFEAEAAQGLDDPERFAEVGKILGNDLGQMRVRFVQELYVVQPAYRDDNSFLWEFEQDAPPDTPPEESLSRTSVQIEATDQQADSAMHVSPVEQPPGERVEYPEWDHRENLLRDAWATVHDRSARDNSTVIGTARRRSLMRGMSLDTRARTLDRAIRLRRQHEGEALDLNAAIESRISWRAGISPDPRIFQRPGKRRRHASILLLMDLSESTNDRVKGFTSVLDVEKEAADLLAQSIDTDYDRLAIDGFHSDGRNKVHYLRFKEFDEAYGDEQRGLLMRQQGSLSTRMGAALRHAGSRLRAQVAEKRILLLVTDGEPSDIDVSDRDYLVEDAQHAVHFLHMKGITVFCLTLDKQGDGYMKKVFGMRNYLIVDNALSLPAQLARALTQIAAR